MSVSGHAQRFVKGGWKLIIFCWAAVMLVGGGAPVTASARSLSAASLVQVQTASLLNSQNAADLSLAAELSFGDWNLVTAVAWSPDGKWLVVGAGDRLWLLQAADLKRMALFDTGALTNSIAFSPDGVWLASGGRDGWLRIWDLQSGINPSDFEPVRSVQAHRKGVNAVTFSPDGRILASGGNDAIARFWDPASGEKLGLMIGGSFAVPSIAFTPDGGDLAVVNGKMLRLRQVGSERINGSFRYDTPLYNATFSPNGKILAVSDQNNGVLLWDTHLAYRSGQEKYPDPLRLVGHQGKTGTFRALIWQVVFSPDGSLLASAGGDGTIHIWEMPGGKPLATLAGHKGGATCLAFRPDGSGLVSGGLDGVLRMWQAK
jgi:WD40 repeat protein